MSLPRLKDQLPGSGEAGELLRRLEPDADWTDAEQSRLWTEIAANGRAAEALARRRNITLTVLGSVALVGLTVWATKAPQPAARSWAHVTTQAGDSLSWPPETIHRVAVIDRETRIYLDRGTLASDVHKRSAGERYVVRTRDAQVTAIGTRFTVTSAECTTAVHVEEGRVEVKWREGSVLLGAGEQKRLSGECAAVSEESPLPQMPLAADLSGENQLYSLGALASRAGEPQRALHAWREHQRRFPSGVLAPEVSLAILRTLLREREFVAALGEADALTSKFPEQARPAVSLLAAEFKVEATSLPALVHALAKL